MNIIVACTADGGIGKNGTIPWSCPDDLKHFRTLTIGKTVIMGRKTWESLPRRPLPGRRNIVLTRSKDLVGTVECYSSFDEIPEDILIGSFVIGGAQIYREALNHPLCRDIHMTKISGTYECDTFFPGNPSNPPNSLAKYIIYEFFTTT